ncbi:4-coumarate ligase [Fusarium pseudoanthophilum]|uniref:4-coumarate ligase n=1 Tax=Fusarium pseudoanthophilum TaxID=48495 RepID=A0A8H5P8G1_9HYPO|nr:4-coumarate ligase [Fusarium pseudoanthophilum]
MFSSRYEIKLPNVDVLTYLFRSSVTRNDGFVFLDAENPIDGIYKEQLEERVKRLAGGLRKIIGLQENDVVLAFTENSIWYPVIVLASICAGGIFTGANPVYTSMELTRHLRISGAKCIFTDLQRLDTAVQAANIVRLPRTSIVIVDQTSETKPCGYHGIHDLLDVAFSWEVIHDREVLADKTAVLNFSSGTTGDPKACMITHRNLIANSEQQLYLDNVAYSRSPDSKRNLPRIHCAFLPLYHASGLITYCVMNVRSSCTTAIMRKFNLKLFLDTIQRLRVTELLLAPPVVLMLAKSDIISQYDLSSVELMFCGGAPLQPDLSQKLEAVFNSGKVHLRQGWGMTEATMAVTLFAPDEFDVSHAGVGYLIPNMQMKILKDDGQLAGPDEEGEALIRGPNIFNGYYRNPKVSREILDGEWLRTGDIVMMDKGGLLKIVDRKKELIKVKGFQVAPSEIEGVLLEHEHVIDCAVVRVIRDGQEHPRAFVVRSDNKITATDIMEFLQAPLSAHKKPTGGIVFVDAIPKSPSGKILRRMLQEPASKGIARL